MIATTIATSRTARTIHRGRRMPVLRGCCSCIVVTRPPPRVSLRTRRSPGLAEASVPAVHEVERHRDREHDREQHEDEQRDAGERDQRRAGALAQLRLVLERLGRLDRMLHRVDDVLRLLLELHHWVWVPRYASCTPTF